jgi:hypothetical protein
VRNEGSLFRRRALWFVVPSTIIAVVIVFAVATQAGRAYSALVIYVADRYPQLILLAPLILLAIPAVFRSKSDP